MLGAGKYSEKENLVKKIIMPGPVVYQPFYILFFLCLESFVVAVWNNYEILINWYMCFLFYLVCLGQYYLHVIKIFLNP